MRLLIIGQLEGQLGAAAKIARERGGKVIPAADVDAALRALRYGGGADLIVADATLDIRALVHALEAERMNVPATSALIGRTVFDVERDLILDTLDYCLGNRTHTANILGISVRTLRNKLRDYAQADIDVVQPGTARMVG